MINGQSHCIEIGSKQIGEYITDAYRLKLHTQSSELYCYASIQVNDLDNSITPTELVKVLHNLKITETVDLEQIAIFCAEAAQGNNPQDILIAAGHPAQHGEDGWFELLVSTETEQRELEKDDRGRVIDFKAIHSFSNVGSGEAIGRYYPPTAGTDGRTVTGKTIHSIHGSPSKVTSGNGTTLSEDETEVLSDREGRVIFEHNMISVVEELVITGDVDLSVGHISFNGFVLVTGDILDDFKINAQKGLKVKGSIGKNRIISDGPVTIGSMAGRGEGEILCKGNLTARYLNQVKVECYGNVIVEHELRNSVIKSTGAIIVSKGLISGGECVALEGIEAKMGGNRNGVKTHLTSGVYFPESDYLTKLRHNLQRINEQLQNIVRTIKDLNKAPLNVKQKSLQEALDLRIGILTQRATNLEVEKEEITVELAGFELAAHPTENAKVNIKHSLQEGVIIHLGASSEEIKLERNGPLSIIEDSVSGGLRFMSYTPLSLTASDLEADLQGDSQSVSGFDNPNWRI